MVKNKHVYQNYNALKFHHHRWGGGGGVGQGVLPCTEAT